MTQNLWPKTYDPKLMTQNWPKTFVTKLVIFEKFLAWKCDTLFPISTYFCAFSVINYNRSPFLEKIQKQYIFQNAFDTTKCYFWAKCRYFWRIWHISGNINRYGPRKACGENISVNVSSFIRNHSVHFDAYVAFKSTLTPFFHVRKFWVQ